MRKEVESIPSQTFIVYFPLSRPYCFPTIESTTTRVTADVLRFYITIANYSQILPYTNKYCQNLQIAHIY